ncbi:MAG: response regulator [Phycisphaerae bacterium]|nr:response regulator [Phycisphaerae bacterium]
MFKTATEKQMSVLLIDDDSDYRWLISDAMNMTGMECSFKESQRAYEGLAMLKNSNPKELPDMILVDIEMPGMTGIEFLEEVKKEPTLRGITTIIVSGVKMRREQRDELLQKGAAGVVLKTPDIYEMTRRLKEAVDRAA